MMYEFLALAAMLVAVGQNDRPGAELSELAVQVAGFEHDDGECVVSLFSSTDGFPMDADKAVRNASAAVTDGQCAVTFAEVSRGTYALAAFHDTDSDGELDTSWFGKPKEAVGASNDARGRFGPPKFEAAAFEVTELREVRRFSVYRP